jgi:hypothetical protein
MTELRRDNSLNKPKIVWSGRDFVNRGGGAFSIDGKPIDKGSKWSYSAMLVDMDGVLHRTGVAIDGASEFLKQLRAVKSPFLLLTNEDRVSKQMQQRFVANICHSIQMLN